MQQRYYDPGIGMFLSVDPVTAYSNPVGQFNRYRYANGNPFRFYDPTGLLGEVLNPDQKGPNMVLVNDGQGNQMYVSASVASDTLLATSLGTTTGDLNTVTQKEKAAVTIVLGTASIVGSEIAGCSLDRHGGG